MSKMIIEKEQQNMQFNLQNIHSNIIMGGILMKNTLKGFIRPLAFTAVGALVGFIYYLLIGCQGGTCAISSDPINSMMYFGFLGLIMSGPLCPSCRNGSCDITPKDKE